MSIGSDKARVWARELPLGKCSAKAVMLAIANYVDENGHCFPSASTLAHDTDQTEGNVRRLLKWLEDIGVIARLKRWRVDNGSTVITTYGEGGGRQTSDEIRLCLQIDHDTIRERIAAIETRSKKEPSEQSDEDVCLGKIDRQHSENEDVCLGSPAEAIAYAPQPTHEESILEERDSTPQSPPSFEKDDLKKQFKATYPVPSNRPQLFETRWAALSIEQCRRALRGAEGVKAVRSKDPKRAVVDPAKFISDEAFWTEFEPFAPPARRPLTFVPLDSDEWRALAVMRSIAGLPPLKPTFDPMHDCQGAKVPGPLPAGASALAAFASDAGEVDRSDWIIIHRDSKQFFAWSERVAEWIGRRPEPDRIRLSGSTTKIINGKPMELPNFAYGLLVPCEWPPPKGDRKDTTGPPLGELSDQDAREFVQSSTG